MGKSLLIEVKGAVARLTLNRPEFGNAIDVELARELYDVALACEADDKVRCVVIAGTGRLFCAGGDVRALHAAGTELPTLLKDITGPLHAAYLRFAQMRKPVIAAVHGPAAGAGIGLACSCDLVIADHNASFTLAYSSIGLSPDGGATWLLPRLIGLRRTQELCMTKRRLSAREAAQIGLITRAVDVGSLEAEVEELAATLASSATGALGVTKRLLLQTGANSFATQLDDESRGISLQGATTEALEGIRAFVEKRPVRFG